MKNRLKDRMDLVRGVSSGIAGAAGPGMKPWARVAGVKETAAWQAC